MLIFYTERFIPVEHGACTYGPVILIRPKYKNDEGLLAHEKYHRKRWLMTLGISGVLYRFSKEYRLKEEIKAYKIQSEYYDDKIAKKRIFAKYISDNYNLDITQEKAFDLLMQK